MIIAAYFKEKQICYEDLIILIKNEPYLIQIDELSTSKYYILIHNFLYLFIVRVCSSSLHNSRYPLPQYQSCIGFSNSVSHLHSNLFKYNNYIWYL